MLVLTSIFSRHKSYRSTRYKKRTAAEKCIFYVGRFRSTSITFTAFSELFRFHRAGTPQRLSLFREIIPASMQSAISNKSHAKAKARMKENRKRATKEETRRWFEWAKWHFGSVEKREKNGRHASTSWKPRLLAHSKSDFALFLYPARKACLCSRVWKTTRKGASWMGHL